MPKIIFLSGLLVLASLVGAAEPGLPGRELLGLFPDSEAPVFFEKQSELVLQKSLQSWAHDKKWHPELDEKNVFLATLEHRSVTERSWELGIGKGGQIYSMYSTFGEAMAPSRPQSQWNDEVWQMTTIYADLLGRDLPENPKDPTRQKFSNAYVHQSGAYSKEDAGKAFYSPLLAERFDEERRAYSVLSWGLIPSPSINRSGILVYVQYRDLGAGVIEVTYIVYNFEKEPMTNLSPWGGVRTSIFPEHVVSNPDGSYRYFTPFHYAYDDLEGCRINFEDTGGWAAVAANADNPYSHAIGVVFGRKLNRKGKHYGKPRYDVGPTRHGERDYTVQATVINIKDQPFTPHLLRMYFVIGTLEKVGEKANLLADHADYQPLDFRENNVPLVPLYARRYGEDTVLSRKRQGDPLCRVYAWPVKGSLPLFVIKNNESKRHFISTDPYAQCVREPFENPLQPGDERFGKYENRSIYRVFKGGTGWVELLGYVMPDGLADRKTHAYLALAEVSGVQAVFDAGEKEAADRLLVRAAN